MSLIEDEHDEGVAIVTLNDPERRNALSLPMNDEIAAAFDAIEADESIGAVVVTGAPPAFCAGADLSHLGSSQEDGLRTMYDGFMRVGRCSLPTLAAVNGAAVGAGINLALACDVRLAGPTARFDVRFMQLGLHPGGGYTWMANRVLGAQGAAAMTLFCDVLDAAEAQRVGLVWRSYDSDEALLSGARELAGRAASADRKLIEATKATMRVTSRLDSQSDATDIEVRAQAESVHSEDFRTRVAALQARISKK